MSLIRLLGEKATKLGSCDKNWPHYSHWNVDKWYIRNDHVLLAPVIVTKMMLKVMIYDNDENESRRSLLQLALHIGH